MGSPNRSSITNHLEQGNKVTKANIEEIINTGGRNGTENDPDGIN
jgi:hypothetical protein